MPNLESAIQRARDALAGGPRGGEHQPRAWRPVLGLARTRPELPLAAVPRAARPCDARRRGSSRSAPARIRGRARCRIGTLVAQGSRLPAPVAPLRGSGDGDRAALLRRPRRRPLGADSIERVWVVGAGVIGSLFAAYLARVCDVSVLCRREEHARALRSAGCACPGGTTSPPSSGPPTEPDELPDFDLAIVATKGTELEAAAARLEGRSPSGAS